jgi:hypothetical protein
MPEGTIPINKIANTNSGSILLLLMGIKICNEIV